MFSTLLGVLPPRDPASREGVLRDLADVGLELAATGEPPAGRDASPENVVAAWLAASAATDVPVKQVLAGPYSAGRDGRAGRPIELAEGLRPTIEALAAAGCSFVEVAEPDALAIALVEGERRRFVEAHRRLLDGTSGIHVSLALTGGNLDLAGPSTFFDLAYASYAFDLIAGPDNWRLIASAPGDRGIVLGALDPRPAGDESPELLVWAAHYAASTGGRGTDRVGLANAPSLGDVPWDVALRKLRRVAEAARMAGLLSAEELGKVLDPRAFGGRRDRPGGPIRLGDADAGGSAEGGGRR
jgi:methionine synthase II (cobalamin-independent)